MNIEKRKEKPKVVLDTNVIISGLNFRGRPREILDLIRGEKIELYISPFILEEVRGVLKEKFSWDEERIQTAIEKLKAALVEPEENISVIKKDEDDNRILECGVEGKVQYIVSGDTKYDIFELADKCMNLWELFLRKNALEGSHPESNKSKVQLPTNQ